MLSVPRHLQAARTIQRWFRGWRLHRHGALLRQLVGVAGELRAAAARFYEHMGATAGHITHRQYLEVNELAMRVIFKLDRWVILGCGLRMWYGQQPQQACCEWLYPGWTGGRGLRVKERDVGCIPSALVVQ